MNKIALLLLAAWSCTTALSQWSIAPGASSLHVDQWDRIVQTYNLAHTWNTKTVAPLQWGWCIGGGYSALLFEKPQVFVVPQLRYSHWSTGNEDNYLALHQISLGPELRFNPRALLFGVESAGPLGPRWYIGLQPGIQCWMPMVERNNKWLRYDEDLVYHPVSVGFDLKVSTGFHALTVGNWVITPEVNWQWIRRAELYDWTEQILGQNILGLSNISKNGFCLSTTLVLTKIKKSDNWWDRPRGS